MTHSPSVVERLDRAVDLVLSGRSPAAAAASARIDPEQRDLLDVASDLRDNLRAPVASPRFEAQLGTRLASNGGSRDPVGWALRHPGRLIVTGAVGSAVGVGVTAYAVWRSSRRAPIANKLLHR